MPRGSRGVSWGSVAPGRDSHESMNRMLEKIELERRDSRAHARFNSLSPLFSPKLIEE